MRWKKVLTSGVMSSIQGSDEQVAIWDRVLKTDDNIIVDAVAGSGKSTTAFEAARRLNPVANIDYTTRGKLKLVYLVFGRANRNEMMERCGDSMEALTFHALGLRALRKVYPKLEVDKSGNSVWAAIDKLAAEKHGGPIDWKIKGAVKRLVGLCKQYDARKDSEIAVVLDLHDIDSPSDVAVIGMTQDVLNLQAADYDMEAVTFDDMCWLPKVWNLPMEPYELVFVDEAQDLNNVQRWIAVRSAHRHVVIGDVNQAIYAFRGACGDSIENLRADLEGNGEFHDYCVNLPLTRTRRCPCSHVVLAQRLVPHIRCLDDAPMGSVEFVDEARAGQYAFPGDLVLSRTNAPLIDCAWSILKRRVPAKVLGNDIGDGLVRLIDSCRECATVAGLLHEAQELTDKKINTMRRDNPERNRNRIAAAEDRLDCLCALSKDCATPDDVRNKIMKLFTDDKDLGAVMLGTIHRTKGMEAGRVWLLNAGDSIPHPMAIGAVQLQQERNLLYIALTRSKYGLNGNGELKFCGGVPRWLE